MPEESGLSSDSEVVVSDTEEHDSEDEWVYGLQVAPVVVEEPPVEPVPAFGVAVEQPTVVAEGDAGLGLVVVGQAMPLHPPAAEPVHDEVAEAFEGNDDEQHHSGGGHQARLGG